MKNPLSNHTLMQSFKRFFILATSLFILFGACIPHRSLATSRDFLYDLEVKQLRIQSSDATKITGTVTILNPTDIYFPDLYLATELYLKIQETESNVINKKFTQIIVPRNGAYTYQFEHTIPHPIPSSNYDFLVRLYERTGIPLNFNYTKFKGLGNHTGGFLVGSPDYSHILKGDERVDDPLSGPEFSIGETPIFVLLLKNTSNESILAAPEVSVYKRSPLLDAPPVAVRKSAPIAFEPNQQKEIRIQLPTMEEPESYFSTLRFWEDSSNTPLSPNFEARYVIKGPNAKILNHFAKADSNVLTISNLLVGPADGSVIDNAILRVEAFDASTNERFITENQNVRLTEDPLNASVTISLKEGVKKYTVVSQILLADAILDSTQFEYDIDIVSKTKDLEIAPSEEAASKPKFSFGILILWVIALLVPTFVVLFYLRRKNTRGEKSKTSSF
jgi:hypothetical protein